MFQFETVLPEVFTENGQRRALPPTYDNPPSDATDIRAQCSYLPRVIIERKGKKLHFENSPKK
jgi:hypothetical protein